jgi:hypothetical protein
MTEQEREELLAKRAELQEAQAICRQYESLRKDVDSIGRKYGYGYNGAASSVEMQIADIDRVLDYDSYLIDYAKKYLLGVLCHPDIAEISRRYLADRGVAVEKPE